MSVKAAYDEKEIAMKEKEEAVRSREAAAEKAESELVKKIHKEAERISGIEKRRLLSDLEDKERKIRSEYRKQKQILEGWLLLVLLYGMGVTGLQAMKTELFLSDLQKCGRYFYKIIAFIWHMALEKSASAFQVKAMIPYPYVDHVAAGLLAVLVFLLIMILFYIFPILFGGFCLNAYYQKFGDKISLSVAMMSMAVLVWFGDKIPFPDGNLILWWFLSHLFYLACRIVIGKS